MLHPPAQWKGGASPRCSKRPYCSAEHPECGTVGRSNRVQTIGDRLNREGGPGKTRYSRGEEKRCTPNEVISASFS
jgi:hypothetical protein